MVPKPSSAESTEIAKGIMNEVLTASFDQIADKAYRLQCVELYHRALLQAIKDIHDVYDLPKPCTDHSHVIDAWKRDKVAKPSPPDSLLRQLK